jgi:hypothetical protein
MTFNRNFTRATLSAADPATGARCLCVEGRSQPADNATAIFVAVPHAGGLSTARVDNPALIDWEARFPPGDPACQVGDDVFVVGVAMLPAPCEPFTWQAGLQIEDQG